MTEADGLRLEAAMQFGFDPVQPDADMYACSEAQLIAFAKSCERAGLFRAVQLAREIAASYDPQNNQENALAGELESFAQKTEQRIREIDAELAPVRSNPFQHGCDPARESCNDCATNLADPPSKLCPGCQAYREHTT